MCEDAPVLLAGLTNSRCIYNWKQLLNIINQKLVEQPFIPFLCTSKNKSYINKQLN